MKSEIVVIILTHKRAKKVVTVKTLKRVGYTGEIILLVDNEDPQIDDYRKIYGEQVEVFDKNKYADMIDEMDNFDKRQTITHARNASYDIAKKRGYKYFIQLDDDYNGFSYRFNYDLEYKHTRVKNLDGVLRACLNFFKRTTFKTIAFAQGGDFIGGGEGGFGKQVKLHRKSMNSFICSTDRRIWFKGRLNEDVDTYCYYGNLGDLFGTTSMITINQGLTQGNSGGITEAYLEAGAHFKPFYTVMQCPSFVKVSMMNAANKRLHHKINWSKAVPCILDPKHKK